MNKVYLVIENDVCESSILEQIKVFSTIENAKKYFRKRIEYFKNNTEDYKELYSTIEETYMMFSVYNEGDYCSDHFELEIKEMIIDEGVENEK